MDDAEFKARFWDTPLSRANRTELARNAAALQGNERNRPTAPARPS
jgi:epoxyqueuosine reductase QueG